MGDAGRRPVWAPRVPRFKIAQLYHTDARGLQDEDLADEVGVALLVRIESCLQGLAMPVKGRRRAQPRAQLSASLMAFRICSAR